MKDRIPSLDGARAFSIALVIAHHAMWGKSLPILWRFDFSGLGVRVFFVISGFLITKLLLEERERMGRISIPQFYLRRAFRILPAAYIYIAVIALLIPVGIAAAYRDIPAVILYYANYHTHVDNLERVATGQFWSLSVEEQFYFLWPAALVVLGTRRAAYACTALLLSAPLFRMLCADGLWPTRPHMAFECVSDALATGCLLAILRNRLWNLREYRAIVERPAVLWVVFAVGVLLTLTGPPIAVCYVIGIPLTNFSIAVLLDRYMRMPQGVGALLNLRPIIWIGTISYSLYIWQQLWMFTHDPILVRIAGALACATLSFYLVEQPMLALRKRLRLSRGLAAATSTS